MNYQERIPTKVYRLTIHVAHENVLGIVESVLVNLGFNQGELITSLISGHWQLMVYREEPVAIRRASILLKKLALKDVTWSVKLLKPEDWASKWKKGWKPGRLTKKLDVVPLWHLDSYKVKKNRDYILMDTLMSFGTGLHETTRIMSQFIEDAQGQFKSFFDIGTGTGVLTLVALKSGAKQVLAIDIGQLSVEAAKKNGELNKLPFRVLCRDIADMKHAIQYDYVAANLVTHDLVSFRKQIVRFVKPNGLLAVSGISLDNWEKFNQGFLKPPLEVIQIVKGKQWAGVLCRLSSTKKM